MKLINLKKILLIPLLLFSFSFVAEAKDDFLINWKASVYVPFFYTGKALPTLGSKIEVSFELLHDDQIVSLKGREVRWFIGNKQVAKGPNLKKTIYNIPGEQTGNLAIRLEVSGPYGEVNKVFTIPVTSPKVVIEDKNQGILNKGNNNYLAWPYFFNVKKMDELGFTWQIDEDRTTGKPDQRNTLDLNVAKDVNDYNSELSATIQKLNNLLEIGRKSINLKTNK